MLSFLKRKKKDDHSPPLSPGEAFQDPFADTIDWSALTEGSNDSVYDLKIFQESPLRLKYGYKLSDLIRNPKVWFLYTIAIAPIVFAIYIGLNAPDALHIALMLGCGFFIPLCVALYAMWMNHSKYIFDKTMGYYWKGGVFGAKITNPNHLKKATRLDDIYALQLVQTVGRSGETSYELNVVFHQGKRAWLTSRFELQKLQTAAQELAEFLEVPLWDRSDIPPPDRTHSTINFKKVFQKPKRKRR